jgi:hypothetical protein
LTAEHKYKIVQLYFASPHFDLESKKALKTRYWDGDNSDKARNVYTVCDFSLPDAEIKAHLWDEITDAQSKSTLMELRQKVEGFWQRD